MIEGVSDRPERLDNFIDGRHRETQALGSAMIDHNEHVDGLACGQGVVCHIRTPNHIGLGRNDAGVSRSYPMSATESAKVRKISILMEQSENPPAGGVDARPPQAYPDLLVPFRRECPKPPDLSIKVPVNTRAAWSASD